MSDESKDIDLPAEIKDANKGLAIDLSRTELPLDMAIRSTALTLAVRHCGDVVVREGNLYQQLKMDNKLAGPLTVDHVIHAARIFELYLWGKWSQDLAGQALAHSLDEMEKVIGKEADKKLGGLEDEDPSRPHSGGDVP